MERIKEQEGERTPVEGTKGVRVETGRDKGMI